MRTLSLLLCVGLVIFGMYAEAAVSRTTEYHALSVSITSDTTRNITLPDGVFATGLVKDQNGNPVKGAFVSAALQQGLIAAVGAFTDATGKFTLPVQPGPYIFYVTPPSSASVSSTSFSRLLRNKLDNISVTADTAVGTIVLPNGFILSGKVLSPSGPLGVFSGVFWTFPTSGGSTGFQAAQFGAPPAGSTQYGIALAAGSYKSVLMPFLTYSSSFQPLPLAYSTTNFTLNSDKTMDLKLRNGFSLSGTVKDAAGKPLKGFVWIYQKGNYEPGVYVAVGLVNAGKYQTYLPKGNYTAIYVPVQDPTYNGRAAMTSQDLVMPAGSKVLNITAKNGVILSGKVMDAHNHAMKSSGVMLRGSGNNPWGPSQITYAAFGTTTANGSYRLVVPPGTDDLVAYPQISPKPKSPEAAALEQALRMLANSGRDH